MKDVLNKLIDFKDPSTYDREVRVYTEKYGGDDQSKKQDPYNDGIYLELLDEGTRGVERSFSKDDYIRIREITLPKNLIKTVDANILELKRKILLSNYPVKKELNSPSRDWGG